MVFDGAVSARVYKRNDVFVLPLSFFQQAASQCGGAFLPKEDWSQVLFLCQDALAISFWLQRPEGASHTLVSIDLDALSTDLPELLDLWLWKHVDETWDEVRAQFSGSSSVSDYARGVARAYPQCVTSRLPAGLN